MGKRGPKLDPLKAANREEYHAWRNAVNRGVVPAWEAFATFLQDVGPKPEGHALFRLDASKPFGPENSAWGPLGLVRSHGTQLRHYFRSAKHPRTDMSPKGYIDRWGQYYPR